MKAPNGWTGVIVTILLAGAVALTATAVAEGEKRAAIERLQESDKEQTRVINEIREKLTIQAEVNGRIDERTEGMKDNISDLLREFRQMRFEGRNQ